MKPLTVVLVLFCLAAIVAGQEVSRRERLRSLISAARGGDIEARNALKNLRDKLRRRIGDAGRPNFEQQQQQQQQHQPQIVPAVEEAQTVFESEPLVAVNDPPQEAPSRQFPQRQSSQRQISQSEPRTRFRPTVERERTLLEPHQALNRGLEVDTRSEANAVIRVTNKTRTPPIQTIRRYSYYDEQGNYIFGYEAADGSFKEEKRGLDCIVHGKYGYVDPEGVKREFTYVSGNKCDPNAPRQDDPQAEQPRNDHSQFLIQTEERRVDPIQTRARPEPVNRIQTHTKPEPVEPLQTIQAERRPVPSRRRRPVETQKPQAQKFKVFSEAHEKVHIKQQTIEEKSSVKQVQESRQDIPQTIPQTQSEPEAFKPVEAPKKTFPHFQIVTPQAPNFRPTQAPIFTPQAPSFRPTQAPIFNFDQEFQNIFSNFEHQRQPFHFAQTPRPRTAPSPAPAPVRTPAPSPVPAPKPPKIVAAVQEPKPANVPHQLIFDANTGTFKTVPLTSFVNPSSSNTFSNPSGVGKPLPLATGSNPLPPVPFGSLTFTGSSSNNNAAQFDNFFNRFHFN